MFRGMSAVQIFFWNAMIVAAWHVAVFIACVKLPASTFDAAKKRYLAKGWERGGRWYKDHLKINLWKDRVPQHIGKDGFSKAHITGVSVEYLDEFILETCRGEWIHFTDCLCAGVVFVLNPLWPGVLFAFLILLGNVPFALIQRYNRFRLQTVKKKILREQHALQAAATAASCPQA